MSTSEIDNIIQKRDSLLAEIVEINQQMEDIGVAHHSEALYQANINLYVFRRDCAKTHAQRIDLQKKIIEIENNHVSVIEKRLITGTVSVIDKLKAQNSALAAKQTLLELQQNS